MIIPLWLISICLIGFGLTLAVLYTEMARLRKRASVSVTDNLSSVMFIVQMLEDDTKPIIYETLLSNIQAEVAELQHYAAGEAYDMNALRDAVRDTTNSINRLVTVDVERITLQKRLAENLLSEYKKELAMAKTRVVLR